VAEKESPEKKPSTQTVAENAPASVQPRTFKLQAVPQQPDKVNYVPSPPPYPRRQRIHPRRVLPRVKEGREREFHSTTLQLSLHLQAAPASLQAATDDLTLVTNSELIQPGQKQLASSVGEPSTAADKQVVMFTGNWYAARSIDGGGSFQYIDPFTSFPDPPNLGFCCDQVVNYIPSIDTFVWLMQYGPTSGPDVDNIQRLAFAKSDDVAAGKWRLFDITTQNLGLAGKFLDFPDLAVGANFLYVTSNVFTPQGQSAGAVVVRLRITDIDSGQITAQTFPSTDLNSFRVAQNCGTKAYFAAHLDSSTLRVFTWADDDAQPTSTDIGVARWLGGQGYQSTTPDGNRWLDRVDPRITGATYLPQTPMGPELWFAWSVDKGSNLRPNAFVQIARLDATNLTLLENVNVFDLDSATAYGALSTNSDNEVGLSYMLGGGPKFPSHMVAILTGTRKDLLTKAGDRGPADAQWGDYLTVRSVLPGGKLFAATGYTMNGPGDGSNRDATPRYVVFGRASNAAAGQAPSDGQATALPGSASPVPLTKRPKPPIPPSPPGPSAGGGAPITDVNSLQIVSQQVAEKIKKACGFTGTPGVPAAVAVAAAPMAPQADKPGSERWPVKTGQDPDRVKVGKNIVNGVDLTPGIVETTIEELISLPRPPGLEVLTADPPAFKSVRDGVTEVTIWRLDAKILALKHEQDGDYHLVLQGASGREMVGEIPTPTTEFVGDSPWIANIGQARKEIDDKLVKHLSPASFALMNDKYVPQGALMFQPQATASPGMSFVTPPSGSGQVQPLFATAIAPTRARITGVGFFDRAHGATGAAPNVIELHPVLKVEWLP
jgi:hypothetical protein